MVILRSSERWELTSFHVYQSVGIPSGKSGAESVEVARTRVVTIVVSVIVAVLLVSPLVACYIFWFKYHRTRILPDDVEQEHLTIWDRL